MCLAHLGRCLGKLARESEAASCAGGAAWPRCLGRVQADGRPIKTDGTECVLNEVLYRAEAHRLPAHGPQSDHRCSDAARPDRLIEEAGNRPSEGQLGIGPGEDAALTLRRSDERRLTQGAERRLEMTSARFRSPVNVVARDVQRQLQRVSIRVCRRPGAAPVRKPVEGVASEDEQSQRRGESCLGTEDPSQ